MDIDALQIKIEKAKAELTDETKAAIESVDWKQEILNLKTKFGFSLEQLSNLELEMELMFCGLTTPDEFQKEIQNRLQMPEGKTVEVINEINEKVFKKIRTSFMKSLGNRKEESEDTPIRITTNNTEPVIENKTEEITKKEDTSILQTAGIEITPTNFPIAKGEAKEGVIDISEHEASKENREDMLKNVEKPEMIINKPIEMEKPKILTNIFPSKLAGSFKLPTEKTEYKLNNLTKGVDKVSSMIATPHEEKGGLPKSDPYRELPE